MTRKLCWADRPVTGGTKSYTGAGVEGMGPLKLAFLCLVWMAMTIQATYAAENQLRCRRTNQPLPYFCRPVSTFWGVAIGMSSQDAFSGLCRTVPKAEWSLQATSESESSPRTKGLGCIEWPHFASSKIWVLRVNGYPCTQVAYAIIVVNHAKIVNYTIMCGELRDKSLLASPD